MIRWRKMMIFMTVWRKMRMKEMIFMKIWWGQRNQKQWDTHTHTQTQIQTENRIVDNCTHLFVTAAESWSGQKELLSSGNQTDRGEIHKHTGIHTSGTHTHTHCNKHLQTNTHSNITVNKLLVPVGETKTNYLSLISRLTFLANGDVQGQMIWAAFHVNFILFSFYVLWLHLIITIFNDNVVLN